MLYFPDFHGMVKDNYFTFFNTWKIKHSVKLQIANYRVEKINDGSWQPSDPHVHLQEFARAENDS